MTWYDREVRRLRNKQSKISGEIRSMLEDTLTKHPRVSFKKGTTRKARLAIIKELQKIRDDIHHDIELMESRIKHLREVA